MSKQKSKLTVNKTGHIEVKWKKRGRREGRKKAEERWKVTKREKRGERRRKWPLWNWIMALPVGHSQRIYPHNRNMLNLFFRHIKFWVIYI